MANPVETVLDILSGSIRVVLLEEWGQSSPPPSFKVASNKLPWKGLVNSHQLVRDLRGKVQDQLTKFFVTSHGIRNVKIGQVPAKKFWRGRCQFSFFLRLHYLPKECMDDLLGILYCAGCVKVKFRSTSKLHNVCMVYIIGKLFMFL